MIKLSQYLAPELERTYKHEKFYRVALPGGHEFNFTSEKAVKRWFVELNKHLNKLAHELNDLLAAFYREYRVYFFSLNSGQRRQIESYFEAINRSFDLLVTRSASPNGHWFTYDRFNKILASLRALWSLLNSQPMNSALTVQRYRLANLADRLEYCEARLSVFPDC